MPPTQVLITMKTAIQQSNKTVSYFPAAAADSALATRLLAFAADRSEPILLPQLVAGGQQHAPDHPPAHTPAPHQGSCLWPALRLWQGGGGLQHMARAVGDAPVQVRSTLLGSSSLTAITVKACLWPTPFTVPWRSLSLSHRLAPSFSPLCP